MPLADAADTGRFVGGIGELRLIEDNTQFNRLPYRLLLLYYYYLLLLSAKSPSSYYSRDDTEGEETRQ